MTTEQIREMLQSPAYEFLRSNEHLKGKIIFLTLGGSYSYGTNVETSDVDMCFSVVVPKPAVPICWDYLTSSRSFIQERIPQFTHSISL